MCPRTSRLPNHSSLQSSRRIGDLRLLPSQLSKAASTLGRLGEDSYRASSRSSEQDEHPERVCVSDGQKGDSADHTRRTPSSMQRIEVGHGRIACVEQAAVERQIDQHKQRSRRIGQVVQIVVVFLVRQHGQVTVSRPLPRDQTVTDIPPVLLHGSEDPSNSTSSPECGTS